MKLFIVATIARQIDGEYVFVKTEKGFKKAAKADAYVAELKKIYNDSQGNLKPVMIQIPDGSAECHCTVGAFEVEIEEGE